EKGGYLRPRVADEDVKFPKLDLRFAKHVCDLFRACHISLRQETIGPAFADLRERLFCGGLVLGVVDRHLESTLLQRPRGSPPDATGTASDQRVFFTNRHIILLQKT